MTNSASISGRVVNAAGNPLANATLHLSSDRVFQTTSSDPDGSFLFDDLAPGRYSMLGEYPGYHQQPYGIPLSVAEAEHLGDLVFTLIPSASISGKVTHADGTPASAVHVLAQKWLPFHRRASPISVRPRRFRTRRNLPHR